MSFFVAQARYGGNRLRLDKPRNDFLQVKMLKPPIEKNERVKYTKNYLFIFMNCVKEGNDLVVAVRD